MKKAHPDGNSEAAGTLAAATCRPRSDSLRALEATAAMVIVPGVR
jgi:hypothetical protein